MKALKNYIKNRPHAKYALFLPAFLACFFSLEALIQPEDVVWWVYCRLDDTIPFLEGFAISYYLWYPLLIGTGVILLHSDGEGFKKYILFLIIGFGATLLFDLIVPNGQALRPESFPRDNALTALVGLMYSMDTPTNVFPSMHVIGSIAAAAAAYKSEKLRSLRPLWTVLAVFISLSTVFIKQHSILDIVGGLIFSAVIYFIVYAGSSGRPCQKH